VQKLKEISDFIILKMKVPAFVILFIYFVSYCHIVDSQPTNTSFERITTKDGLSNSTVNYIIQDKKGFMWFATYGGLNKYDGHTFKVYRNIENDNNSLSNDGSIFLYEDNDGFIWVANNANNGFDKFDPVTELFTRYKYDPNDSTSISSNEVYNFVQDKSGNIWVCTKNALNLVVNKKIGNKTYTSFKRFYYLSDNASCSIMFENKDGKLLLFGDYLYNFDRKTFKFNI